MVTQQILNLSNNTGGDITINDLGGITISNGATLDLIGYFGIDFDDVAKSNDLQTLIDANPGNITISDGERTFSSAVEAAGYLSDEYGHGLATLLASTAANNGASQVGVEDIACFAPDNTVQGVLEEVCGGFPNDPNYTFTNNVTVGGDVTVDGYVSTTELNVNGPTDLCGGDVHVCQNLIVDGYTTIGSTLDVTGATTLSSTLDVDGYATFNDSVLILQNLTVLGTTTTIDSEQVTIGDPQIVVNFGSDDTTADNAGLVIDRGQDPDAYAGILWDEDIDRFFLSFGNGGTAEDGYQIITTNEIGTTVTEVGATGTAGTGINYSLENHQHKGVHSINASGNPDLFGDVEFAGGGATTVTQAGQLITISTTLAGIDYGTDGYISQIDAGDTVTAGVEDSAARSDHQHAVNTAADIDIEDVSGSASAAGTSSTLARGDHSHRGLHSITTSGGTDAYGDIVLDSYAGVTVEQSGNTFTIKGGDIGVVPANPENGNRLYLDGYAERRWYTYNETSDLWLSDDRKTVTFNSNSRVTTNSYMKVGEVYTSTSGWRVSHNAVLAGLSFQADAAGTFTIEVRKNDSATVLASLSSGGAAGASTESLNVLLDASDYLQVYVNGSQIEYPIAWLDLIYYVDPV